MRLTLESNVQVRDGMVYVGGMRLEGVLRAAFPNGDPKGNHPLDLGRFRVTVEQVD